jgi:DNA-binding CsgD family transcriptional regulator
MLIQEIGLKLAESMSRSELSKRETQVLHYLALGRSNKEIGRALHISEGIVKAAANRIAIGRNLRRVQYFEHAALSRQKAEFQSHE